MFRSLLGMVLSQAVVWLRVLSGCCIGTLLVEQIGHHTARPGSVDALSPQYPHGMSRVTGCLRASGRIDVRPAGWACRPGGGAEFSGNRSCGLPHEMSELIAGKVADGGHHHGICALAWRSAGALRMFPADRDGAAVASRDILRA